MRISAIIVLAVIASSPRAFAQSELPRGSIGIIAAAATTDEASRMRLAQRLRPWVIAGEVSVRVAPRVAVGVEAIDLGTATGETSGRSFRSEGEQHERAMIGLVRVRVNQHAPVAIDLVGGAGVLVQRHTIINASCFIGCATTLTEELTNRAPMFAAGVDVPVRIARHVSVAAIGRYYFLRRGDNASSGPNDVVPWQFEYRPSGRIAIGGSARVVW